MGNSRFLARSFDNLLLRTGLVQREHQPAPAGATRQTGHVLIIGFGPAGKEAAHIAQLSGLKVQIIEMNPASVRNAIRADIPAMVGDATQPEILEHANLKDAVGVVVTLPDTDAAIAAVTHARRINSEAVIVVRARHERRAQEIRDAGADHVLAEETAVGTLLGTTIVGRTTGIDAVLPEAEERAS